MPRSGPSNALVLTPHGRDATLVASILGEAGITSTLCRDLPHLVSHLNDDASFAVVAEEALRHADLTELAGWIDAQPSWSDLPVILFIGHGGGPERNPAASRYIEGLGNVSFVERPFHPMTFVSVARSALRARRRQYDARTRLNQLHDSEDRLDTALQAGRLGAWELDLRSGNLIASANCKAHFGRSAEDAFTREDMMASAHPGDRARVTGEMERSVHSGRDYAVEYRVLHPDESVHWLEVRARVLQNEAGVALRIVGVSADVSPRKEAEAGLRALNETLEARVKDRTRELEIAHADALKQAAERERTEKILRQAQKMETLGQLTGGVAHDFNNLLMAILASLDLLKKQDHSARAKRLIDNAMEGARRGAKLTQRLLAFSRQQELDVKPVDLKGLILGMEELLRRSLGPSIELLLHLDSNLPTAKADANQVEMALLNLAVNSRDAMPSGGTLTSQLRSKTKGDQPGTFNVITVADTGSGMNAATLARAMEPFYSTKEVGKGTGLGLSMVHGLATQLKGAFTLESTPGEGTRAELWLPVSGVAVSEAQAAAEVDEPHAAQQARILFVDDDALIAISTVDMLEDLGHDVIGVHSGAEALAVLEGGERVDLLITDHAMPNMTGSQLAEAARVLRPHLPILLATGYAELPDECELQLPRLAKPYDQKQIDREIRKLVSR